ncbi:hypothetical protein ACTVCO_10660 [Sanguibacter sp. A247]|uniref:hypothetical protein n=1 Tax=unclassified Sanguibacter TaxID=2645534 RepID=UPI003FD89AF5
MARFSIVRRASAVRIWAGRWWHPGRAGGFDPVAAHEDVGLVARLRALPVRIVASDVVDVLTSGRTEGRAPHGYAQYLRERFTQTGSTAVAPC